MVVYSIFIFLHISERDRNPRNIYNKTWRNGGKKDLVWQKLVPTYRCDINKFSKICLRKYFRLIGTMYLQASIYGNYLPLEKGGALHFNKLESPSCKDALCQVSLKLAQWFLRRSRKQEKFTDGRTDRQTDKRGSEKLI